MCEMNYILQWANDLVKDQMLIYGTKDDSRISFPNIIPH